MTSTGEHNSKTAIIIGAGPAGLTAAFELQARTNIKPIVFEQSGDLGGLSRTVDYKGNKFDLGGHRFFSKSERVMNWWQSILPVENAHTTNAAQNKSLIFRKRVSRIFYRGHLFPYPILFSSDVLKKLGLRSIVRILLSYGRKFLYPIRQVTTLEDFFINRFGSELYCTFFKDYTEKVWGVPASALKADWGHQRIKSFSIVGILIHAIREKLRSNTTLEQKRTETTLINHFLYPKLGPGQLWTEVGDRIQCSGGTIHLHHRIVALQAEGNRITHVTSLDITTGKTQSIPCDYLFSTMPTPELIRCLDGSVPEPVKQIADGLQFRDFIIVTLLTKQLSIGGEQGSRLNDQWIYIQDNNVKLARLQIFNNWSPYLVQTNGHFLIGAEYFCNEGDPLWNLDDRAMKEFAIRELSSVQFLDADDVVDGCVVRIQKAYPMYTGVYDQMETIRQYTDRFENLFLIGRNGQHRYNNQDHSMLTAMTAVDNIINGIESKANIWEVNLESDYHEESRRQPKGQRMIKKIFNVLRTIITRKLVLQFDKVEFTYERLSWKRMKTWLLTELSYVFRSKKTWAFPTHLQIEPTNLCNLRCPLCHVITDPKPKGSISFTAFQSIIDEVGDYLLFLQFWGWGEPFLNDDFFKMIRYAKDKGIKVISSTNGHFLSDENTLDQLIDSQLDVLIVAVDGLDNETYGKYRDRGDLEKVLEGIRRLVRRKKERNSTLPRINLRTLITSDNEHQLDDIKAIARELDVDIFSTKTIWSFDNYKEWTHLVPKNPLWRRYEYDAEGVPIRKSNTCKKPWNHPTIYADGTVVPCDYYTGMEFSLGKILTNGFGDVWFGKNFVEFRNRFRMEQRAGLRCDTCAFNYADLERCVAFAYTRDEL